MEHSPSGEPNRSSRGQYITYTWNTYEGGMVSNDAAFLLPL